MAEGRRGIFGRGADRMGRLWGAVREAVSPPKGIEKSTISAPTSVSLQDVGSGNLYGAREPTRPPPDLDKPLPALPPVRRNAVRKQAPEADRMRRDFQDRYVGKPIPDFVPLPEIASTDFAGELEQALDHVKPRTEVTAGAFGHAQVPDHADLAGPQPRATFRIRLEDLKDLASLPDIDILQGRKAISKDEHIADTLDILEGSRGLPRFSHRDSPVGEAPPALQNGDVIATPAHAEIRRLGSRRGSQIEPSLSRPVSGLENRRESRMTDGSGHLERNPPLVESNRSSVQAPIWNTTSHWSATTIGTASIMGSQRSSTVSVVSVASTFSAVSALSDVGEVDIQPAPVSPMPSQRTSPRQFTREPRGGGGIEI